MSNPPAYIIEQRGPDCFAVLGPNKPSVFYAGEYLTICTTDGRDDAEMIAKALNLYGALLTVAA
jgi:hypothetical protein